MVSPSGTDSLTWGRTLSGVNPLVVVTDAHGVILSANTTANALSDGGRPLVGRPFVHGGWFRNMPASAARADSTLAQARSGEPLRREIDVRLDGERQPYEFTVLPEVDASGQVTRLLITGMHVSISDETEASRGAAFMRQLNDAIRPFADPRRIIEVTTRMLGQHLGASRVFYADIDEDAGTYTVRQEYTEVAPSAVGTQRLDQHDGDVLAQLHRGEPVVLRQPQPEGKTTEVMRAVGVAATVCVPLMKQGKSVAFLAVSQAEPRDWAVSETRLVMRVADRCWSTLERVRVQQRLAQTERQFEDLFEYAPDATLLVNSDGLIVLTNRRVEALFGYTAGELVGQPIERLVPESHRTAHVGLRTNYARVAVCRIMTRRPGMQARRKDGSLFPAEICLNPIVTEQGSMVAASVRDLTERERLEHQLQRASKMETIGQLAGGVAHDFNNLLTVINATTELLLYQTAGPNRLQTSTLRDDLQMILDAGHKAATLTQQLLALSRQQVLRPAVVDLNRVIEQMEPMLRRAVDEHVFLRIMPQANALPVLADRAQIDQVVLNLALNGREAMPRGGVLSISLGSVTDDEGEWVTVTVRDTGDGMDAETKRRIFEPFFTTKSRGRGTGLGLSSANGIIEQSGGRIDVDSVLGEGTTFTIRLPRVRTTADPRTAPPRNTPVPRGETVLVVDDEDAVRGVTQMMLEIQGFTVISAESGDAALALFEQHVQSGEALDLVLMDVIMPGRSGPETAERMQAIQAHVPIVFMSGHTADLLPTESQSPAHDFLGKPFTLEQLGDAVRGAIGAQASADPDGNATPSD